VNIASRTPEGVPNRCPVCGAELWVEPSNPALDAPCPQCGCLLWFDSAAIQQTVLEEFGRAVGRLLTEEDLDIPLASVMSDSLDIVELVMQLEELGPPGLFDDAVQDILTSGTLRDLVDYIARRLRDKH
jgi:acyl carrier protein